MKIVFAGRDNCFNRKFIKELAVEHEIMCCLFLEPDRSTFNGKVAKIKSRMKKRGVLKVCDELAFHAFDRLILRRRERKFHKENPEYFINTSELNIPIYHVQDIHHEKWLNMIEKLSPDIIFSICSHVVFKPELYKIPRLGTFVLHEGLTPEYKGLHTSLWALMKKEYQYVGYTVLKVNEQIDNGEILLQGKYNFKDKENYKTWSLIGHNALINGINDIRIALKELERKKQFKAICRENRTADYYTWMGLSKFSYLYVKNYLFKSSVF